MPGRWPRTLRAVASLPDIPVDSALARLFRQPRARDETIWFSLPGGSKLFAVYPDLVILDRNGSHESLLLPRLAGAGPGFTPRVARSSRSTPCGMPT